MVKMNPSLCIFCDSKYGDPLLPFHIEKISFICNVAGNKECLVNSKMCTRCKLDIDLIENAFRLRDVMAGSLNAKLAGYMQTPPAMHPPPIIQAAQPALQAPPLQSSVPTSAPPTSQTPVMPTLVHNGGGDNRPDKEIVQTTLASMNIMHVKEESLMDTPPSSLPQPPLSGAFTFPMASNGLPVMPVGTEVPIPNGYRADGRTPNPTRTNRRRIQTCHKCNISLKTRPYPDAVKHINRCNGKGIRPGRPSMTPKAEVFPCQQCGKKLGSKEALEVHVSKCDGSTNNSRGRKPADNTCMLCSEDLVYRHILKKHLRQKHGINAQRLDDSVLAALKTGSVTGIGVKEQVLSRIQQKMFSDILTGDGDQHKGEGDQPKGDSEVANSSTDPTNQSTSAQETNGVEPAVEDSVENVTAIVENATPIVENATPIVEKFQGSRSRRKVKPSKYVPEIFTCERCHKRFEYQSQYIQHCCFKISEEGNMEETEMDSNGRDVMSANTELVDGINEALVYESAVQGFTAAELDSNMADPACGQL